MTRVLVIACTPAFKARNEPDLVADEGSTESGKVVPKRLVGQHPAAPRNGRPTYDKILSNVADAVASTDPTWNFRVNVSHRNLDGLETVIDDLQQALCGKTASFHLALIDDVGLGYDNDVVYSAENAERFIELPPSATSIRLSISLGQTVRHGVDCSRR